ncbi:MAG: GGDEF domain-containing protein [Aestuariibacter sp.]|nr:GGDEF domain-containing protein [Aestuariibacter sp.]MCP4057964.1 GGDEF domain-containing protein [Pseudoalteromonas sp.]MCP4525672.1 GGDEF domain-containing protein [Aestuariibacter sp.]MCP4949303.1 GGDEF domain-containing protein [Aestuariibacter sp.]
MKRIFSFFLVVLSFSALATSTASQSIPGYVEVYLDLQKRFPEAHQRVKAVEGENSFDHSEIGQAFRFLINSNLYGYTTTLVFPVLSDATWQQIKLSDENLYYGLKGLSILYADAPLKERSVMLLDFRESIPSHIDSDVIYYLTGEIISTLYDLNEISASLIELMLVMDSLHEKDVSKIFQYSKGNAFAQASTIYYELNNLKAARNYCDLYMASKVFKSSGKPHELTNCHLVLSNLEIGKEQINDYQEVLKRKAISPIEKANYFMSIVWQEIHYDEVDNETLANINLAISIYESEPFKSRFSLIRAYINKTYVLTKLSKFTDAYKTIEIAHQYNTPSIGFEQLISMAELFLLRLDDKSEDALKLARKTLYDFYYATPVTNSDGKTALSFSLDKVINYSDYDTVLRKNREQSLIIENQNLTKALLLMSLLLLLALLSLTYYGYRSFKRRSQFDGLTRVYNRSTGLMLLESLYKSKTNRVADSLIIALIDLDDFKKINDTFGHSVGDEVLRVFSEIARNSTRTSDILMRYGGEEFLFAFKETSIEHVTQKLEEIRLKLTAHRNWKTAKANFSANFSAGIAGVTKEVGLQAAIDEADESLYVAKKQGKGISHVKS